MANNCLVTKLKGVVDNDNLEYLGMVKEDLFPTMGTTKVIFNASSTAKILHGTVGGNTEVTFSANEDVYISNKGTILVDSGYDKATILIPKYSLTDIFIVGSQIGVGSYVPDVDLTKFKHSPLNLLSISNGRVVPDIDVLNKVSSLVLINGRMAFTEECDISTLGANGVKTIINLTGFGTVPEHNLKGSLDKSGCSPLTILNVPNTKAVSLSIENFVAYNRGAGRTTGTLSLPWLGACKATFNGGDVANQQNNHLSWTATTITLNGTEISNSDVLVP